MGESGLNNWELKDNIRGGWILNFFDSEFGSIGPRYRGAFEAGELPPRRIRVSSRIEARTGAWARFRAPSLFSRHRSFAVSLEIPPETWTPAASRRDDIILGIWSSLPATWLAQDSAGNPVPSPWRELWTFGADHVWACRVSRTSETESFISACISGNPRSPGLRGGVIHDSDTLISGGN